MVIAYLPLVPWLSVMNLNLSAVGFTLNDSPFSKCSLKINGNP